MYRLPAFKGAPRERDYNIGRIFKGLARTFAPEEGSFEFGETDPPEWSSSIG